MAEEMYFEMTNKKCCALSMYSRCEKVEERRRKKLLTPVFAQIYNTPYILFSVLLWQNALKGKTHFNNLLLTTKSFYANLQDSPIVRDLLISLCVCVRV